MKKISVPFIVFFFIGMTDVSAEVLPTDSSRILSTIELSDLAIQADKNKDPSSKDIRPLSPGNIDTQSPDSFHPHSPKSNNPPSSENNNLRTIHNDNPSPTTQLPQSNDPQSRGNNDPTRSENTNLQPLGKDDQPSTPAAYKSENNEHNLRERKITREDGYRKIREKRHIAVEKLTLDREAKAKELEKNRWNSYDRYLRLREEIIRESQIGIRNCAERASRSKEVISMLVKMDLDYRKEHQRYIEEWRELLRHSEEEYKRYEADFQRDWNELDQWNGFP